MINSEYDTSHRSIKYLYSKTKEVLKEEYQLDNIFCPDLSDIDISRVDFNKTVEVLLLGSFVRSMFELKNWPFKSVRFWVLSSVVKKLIVDEFKLSPSEISVIPRDKILAGKEPQNIDWDKPIDLIYAGRLNEAKNIEALIYMVHTMQKQYSLDVTLHLIGDSDNQEKVYVEYKERGTFSSILNSLIEELDWSVEPKISPFQEQEAWMNGSFENPVYITLSTNVYEDFGVSVQQALNRGWPVIASAWGGHLDIKQPFYQIPFSYLTSFKESKDRGRSLGSLLLDLKPKNGSSVKDFFCPEVVSSEKIESQNQKVSLKNGPASFALFRSEWNNLFLSKEGIQFFDRYRSTFRGGLSSPCDVLIVSDYYNHMDKQSHIIEKFVSDSFANSALRQRGLLIFSYIELCSKKVWEDILKAEKIYIGIPDFRKKLSSSFIRIDEMFEAKDILTLDGGS